MALKKRSTKKQTSPSVTKNVETSPVQPMVQYPQNQNTSNLLILLLIVITGFAGYLFFRVQNLEQKVNGANLAGNQQQAPPSKLTVPDLKKYAKELNLNEGEFNSCLDGSKKRDAVAADTKEGQSLGVNGTPSFFINGKMLVGAQPLEVFKEIIDKELAGEGSTDCTTYSTTLQGYCTSKSFDPVPKTIDIAGLPIKGSENAPVIIVEYSDFECPFCARAFPTVESVMKEYGNNIKLVYKHYPLPFHPNAQKAAEASLCAGDQGKFWEYHDKLFGVGQ